MHERTDKSFSSYRVPVGTRHAVSLRKTFANRTVLAPVLISCSETLLIFSEQHSSLCDQRHHACLTESGVRNRCWLTNVNEIVNACVDCLWDALVGKAITYRTDVAESVG